MKNETFNKHLSELSPYKSTDYSLWKSTKRLKRPIVQKPPLRKANNQWAKTNLEKAELFSKHLNSIFSVEDTSCSSNTTITDLAVDEEIPTITPADIKVEIKNKFSKKKAPGFDLLTADLLKNLPNAAIYQLSKIFNACIKLKYFPTLWKVAEVIMIAKPGKPPNEISSYRPISLLPILSKLLEKLFLNRLKPIIARDNLIPSHQFGFREHHSTVDQIHRITDTIEKALESKKVCSAIFLDVSQAFDKVWHKGLMIKLRKTLPKSYCDFLQSYLSDRYFRVKQEDEYSDIEKISAGVPQGSILGPILYLLYTADLPTDVNYQTATFADDTAILAVGNTVEESTQKLQMGIDKICAWTTLWKIKLNNAKSTHVNFTNNQIQQHNVFIDNIAIPHSNSAKYLGMTLDVKLKWDEHVKKKLQEINLKWSKMYWLTGRKSVLSIHNKLLLYNMVIKPIWSYGIQLWACSNQHNIKIIQTFQNKVLRTIVNAPWYCRNADLHRDLGIPYVSEVIQKYAIAHATRLSQHVNNEVSGLATLENHTRRLRRLIPSDLVKVIRHS